MGAVANAFRNLEDSTGLDIAGINKLSEYWDNMRALYAPFESNLKSCSSDVYFHEMPGNLQRNV